MRKSYLTRHLLCGSRFVWAGYLASCVPPPVTPPHHDTAAAVGSSAAPTPPADQQPHQAPSADDQPLIGTTSVVAVSTPPLPVPRNLPLNASLVRAGMLTGAAWPDGVVAGTWEYQGTMYFVAAFDLREFGVSFGLRDDAGQLWESPSRWATALADAGHEPWWVMNAGMYHPSGEPVGYWVQDGVQGHRVVRGDGDGNFFLLPNGVFAVLPDRVMITETETFVAREVADVLHATQSGPMLLVDGEVHSAFIPDSTFLNIRNAVGTTDGTRLVCAISLNPVSFWQFATALRDGLGVTDALYLDGSVSRAWFRGARYPTFALPVPLGPLLAVHRRATDDDPTATHR